MPYKECKGILTDIGTEELAHMEMISSILYQLTVILRRNKSAKAAMPTLSIIQPVFIRSLPPVSRGRLQPSSPRATPSPICSKIWPQNKRRARPTTTCLSDRRPGCAREPLKFLREREVVHFQRFGDALSVVQSNLDAKNYYAWNPAFDVRPRERSAPAPSRPYPMQNRSDVTAPHE